MAAKQNSTRAPARAVSRPNPKAEELCHVARLGQQCSEAFRLEEELENKEHAASSAELAVQRYAYRDGSELFYRLRQDLMEQAMSVQAGSLAGALFQVALTRRLVDDLLEYVDNKQEDGREPGPTRKYQVKELERKIDRMLWSLREAIERHTRLNADDFGAAALMSRYCRTPVTAAEILERVEDRIAR